MTGESAEANTRKEVRRAKSVNKEAGRELDEIMNTSICWKLLDIIAMSMFMRTMMDMTW